jgi:hypothetical protein
VTLVALTGGITTPLIDITGAGTFTAPFTMSSEVAFGAPGTTLPEGYADFVGAGIVTVDILPATCSSNGACGPLRFADVDYKFSTTPTIAPEIDPSSATSAIALLLGRLLILKSRRRKPAEVQLQTFGSPFATGVQNRAT